VLADLWEDVAAEAEIQDGELVLTQVGGLPVVVINSGGQWFALAGRCTHEDWELGDAFVFDGALICPMHGSRFDLSSGAVLDPPAVDPLEVFELRVVEHRIEVRRVLESPSDNSAV
jgi:3-phenylpropionate/trans-cinnamate dioxygenase ferredoxin subunit